MVLYAVPFYESCGFTCTVTKDTVAIKQQNQIIALSFFWFMQDATVHTKLLPGVSKGRQSRTPIKWPTPYCNCAFSERFINLIYAL